MIIKVIGIGVISAIISLILKKDKPEFAMLTTMCGGIVIAIILLDNLQDLVSFCVSVEGEKLNIISPILKVVAVGYITDFAVDLIDDAGSKTVAKKVELAGKITIVLLCLPLLKELYNLLINVI